MRRADLVHDDTTFLSRGYLEREEKNVSSKISNISSFTNERKVLIQQASPTGPPTYISAAVDDAIVSRIDR